MNTANGFRSFLLGLWMLACVTGCSPRTTGETGNEKVSKAGQALTKPPMVPGLFEAESIPPPEARAEFFGPGGMVVVDTGFDPPNSEGSSVFSARSLLFVLDTFNSTIRRVEPHNGATTTFAGIAGVEGAQDGSTSTATFRKPRAIAASAGALFVADTDNHVIRYVAPLGSTWGRTVTTLAGTARKKGRTDGAGAAARFSAPAGLAYAPDTSTLYVADTGNSLLRTITFNAQGTATVATLTNLVDVDGGGSAPAVFNHPSALLYDQDHKVLFVADAGNHTVRRVDLQNGQVSTLAGQPGVSGAADGSPGLFVRPAGLAQTANALYVTDAAAHTVRKIALDGSGAVTTLAGTAGRSGRTNGVGGGVGLRSPVGLATIQGFAYVADQGNHTLRKIALEGGQASTLVGVGRPGGADGWAEATEIAAPTAIVCDAQHVYVDGQAGKFSIDPLTGSVRVISPLQVPSGSLAISGQDLYSESAYGHIVTDLVTLGRSIFSPGGQQALFQFAGTNGYVYAMLDAGDTSAPQVLQLVATPSGGQAPNPPTMGVNRTSADESHVYGTFEVWGQPVELWRFLAGTAGPLEKFTGYPYYSNNSFGVARGYVYMGEGSTITRHALPIGGGAVGPAELFAGASDQSGAIDGHLSEARFDGLSTPTYGVDGSLFCSSNGILHTVEHPAAGGFRIRSINLDTQTVATIVPHQCTRILLDDFADGLEGWTYENGTPGDRGNKWEGLNDDGRYVFFHEPGEGASQGNGVMTRTLSVRPLAPGGTRLAWNFNYAIGGAGGDVTGTLNVKVEPQGACASLPALNLESVVTTAGTDPDASGFSSRLGSETLSIDVSAFEGCEVELEVLGLHSALGSEAGGFMNIDDVRLEWQLCEN